MEIKVKMTEKYAKFVLNTPQIFQKPNGKMCAEYEPETKAAMLCVLGAPIIGVLGNKGAHDDTFRVDYKVPGIGNFWSYYRAGTDFTYDL